MKERFEKIIQDKLYDLHTDRPVPSWDEMQRRMTLSENAAGIRPRPSRRLWAYAAAAALIAVMLGTGIYQFDRRKEDIAADLPTIIENPAFDFSETTSKPDLFSFDEMTPGKDVSVLSQLMKSAVSVTAMTPAQLNPLLHANGKPAATVLDGFDISPLQAETIQLDDLSSDTAIPVRDNQEFSQNRSSTARANNQEPSGTMYGDGFDWDRFTEKQQRQPWMLSAYTGTFAASRIREANGNFTYPHLSAALFEDAASPLPTFQGEELDHHFPISVGISARKHLTRRWALETGFLYSYLEATGEKTDGSYLDQYRQQVHYLGIPLYASYSLFTNHRWDTYVNGGFMLDIPLAAKYRVRYFNPNGELYDTDYGNLGGKGVLWSATMGAGINYYMLDNFGVYVEPGASYYFSNPNQPYTYRTKHPWSFNVRLGFRVKF